MNYKNKHLENTKKENQIKFNDYRNEDEDDKEKLINEKLSKLLFHHLLKQIKLDQLIWDFDAVSLCPCAMWDEKSFFSKIETGYAFTEDTNDELEVNRMRNGYIIDTPTSVDI